MQSQCGFSCFGRSLSFPLIFKQFHNGLHNHLEFSANLSDPLHSKFMKLLIHQCRLLKAGVHFFYMKA